ncbi:hypothetical protein GIB67_039351 [Kingdonia uniflora]|uniref:C2H2-type domain-containing protein n=1 Tax=Kingdonia uniflora TaxID=39325 RepID=A0A7J7LX38_9MAGN|nr:hypothetical protein GIB67_039351 [Kingdonia uniflora]
MGFDNVPVKRGNEFVEENADGGVRRRVMDMELVMRRELAHREKLEKLQPLTPNESQRSSPDLEFEGPKRKAPNENLLRLQPPQIRQHQPSYGQELALIDPFNFMCKECPVYCSSELNLQMHYNGKKHQKRKHELASRGDEEGLGIKVCELCQVPCMNERAYQQHLVGKKHAAALRAIKISGSLRQVG